MRLKPNRSPRRPAKNELMHMKRVEVVNAVERYIDEVVGNMFSPTYWGLVLMGYWCTGVAVGE